MEQANIKKSLRLLAVFGFVLLLHMMARTGLNDDGVFAGYWENSMWDSLKMRYEQWSSRSIIEAALILLAAANPFIWRVLDTCMVLVFWLNVSDLFNVRGDGGRLQARRILLGLACSFPVFSLCTAGWITTTVNYLWPMSLGTVALRPAKHFFLNERCEKWEYALCPLCIIFAANMEQVCAVLLGVYLLCGMCLLCGGKKPAGFYYVVLGVIILSLGYILSAPGSHSRLKITSDILMPDFDAMHPCFKLWWGFIGTVQYYFEAGSFLFLIFLGSLAALLIRRRKEMRCFALKLIIALYPFTFYLYRPLSPLWEYFLEKQRLMRVMELMRITVSNTSLPGCGVYPLWQEFFQLLAYLLLTACTALTIFFLHGKSRETLLQLLILGAGLMSRVMVGFSPTFIVSLDRTAIFCSAAVLIVAMRNIQIYLGSEPSMRGRVALSLYILANIVLNLINTVKMFV